MPTIAKYRRTAFALMKAAGIPEEDRHWVQESHTGKASMKDWGPADYRNFITGLQRDLGQHRDRHPHVREDQPLEERSPAALGGAASPAQCRLIETISDEIEWRAGRERGPYLFLLRSVLGAPAADLRRAIVERAYDEGRRGIGLWSVLTAHEAAWFLRALARLKSSQVPVQ